MSSAAELMTGIAASPNAHTLQAGRGSTLPRTRPPRERRLRGHQLTHQPGPAQLPVASMMADYTKADSFRLRTAGN